MKFRNRARVNTALRFVAIAATAVAVQGCGKKPETKPPTGGAPGTIVEESIVVREFSKELADDFSFKTTIGQILTSAGIPNTDANQQALVKTMLANLGAGGAPTNPVSALPMKVDPRPKEAGLDPAELLDAGKPNGLIPIGLFNRLDLAPKGWADCGEHRIVYATKDKAPGGRFFLIFEAKLPNPTKDGMKGCKPVAERWQAIGAADAANRRTLLKELYYTALPGGFKPVVDFMNYGGFLGQVRANLFVGNSPTQNPWQLREFRVLAVAPGTLVFSPGVVANNPLAEFYKDNPTGTPQEQAERARFQTAFKARYAAALHSFDEAAAANMSVDDFREGLMNCVGAPIEAVDDEFQSMSQGNSDNPSSLAGPTFKSGLSDWKLPDNSRTVSKDETLNRAGAVTCGGCHQFAAGATIGGGTGGAINWPAAGPFTHISETLDGTKHAISPALRDFFIPHRKKVLAAILNDQEPGPLLCPTTAAAATQKTAAATSKAAAAATPVRTRDDALAAAQRVLQGGAAASTKAATDAARDVRRISDEAHAADQVTPGAVAPFRRPH